jgi:membrane associated rhomboid family serine protease
LEKGLKEGKTIKGKILAGRVDMIRTIIIGGVIGLVVGIIFGILYFGAGQITTPMAYIHDISGLGLGILIAWIIALYRRGKTQ